MDPEKQTDPPSNASTPTRVSDEYDRHDEPSDNTLQEEKTNEWDNDGVVFQAIRTRQEDDEERDLELQAGFRTRSAEEQKDKDPNLVEWDGPDDPENPQNFSRGRKWLITMILSTLTVWITFSSSVFSEATMVTAEEYHVSTEVMTLATSLPVFVRL
jgi:DHA1 family multidrug resistance protein-like MFS transporter